MENIFVQFLPPWVETGLQPAFYDKESGTVLQQTARMYDRVNMLIRMFNKLSKNTKEEVERFEGVVNEEIETFEHDVNETVNEYIGKFNDLYNYVHDYFDNLDVQEEINHKLDDMVSQGTLQEIIYNYLNPSVIWGYDTVADLQSSTDLEEGCHAETLGYYSVGDGGGAKYIIREPAESETPNNITTFAVGDLIAELLVEPSMYVKQFGCKGDDSTDDTTRFNTAIANSKRLYVNAGTYILNRFLPEENQEIIGIGEAIIKVNGTTTPLVAFKSNSKISNLDIRSLNPGQEWNRCDITQKSNVTIENCKISGFLDPDNRNSWGIYIDKSSNINIRNCYFDNNTQSDIAIVEDSSNLTIEDCDGTQLHINFEPNTGDPINNVSITGCKIYRIDMQENDLLKNTIQNMTIKDCTIDIFCYDGADVTVIDCKIKGYLPAPAGVNPTAYGGKLKFINSALFSKNLINDPYLDTLKSDGTEWQQHYSTLTWDNSVEGITSGTEGRCVVLNPNNTSSLVAIRHSVFTVSAGDTYLLRMNSKETTVSSGTGFSSVSVSVNYKDGDTVVENVRYSINRHEINSSSPLEEVSCILKVPEGATSMQLIIWNSPTGTNSLTIRSVELYKISSNELGSTDLETLPIRNKRIFTNTAKPSGNGIQYEVGDMMYYSTPSTYIGAVCTVAGRIGTWKDFGAIAS